MRKSLFTTMEVAKILNISKALLDRLAMAGSDKNHPFYLEFSGGNGGKRLYARNIVKAKLIELGVSDECAEQTLSAFDIQSTQSAQGGYNA